MTAITQTRPRPAELFRAGLMANALVYIGGAVIFTGISYFGTQTGGWLTVFRTLLMFATMGVVAAAALGFLIVAPIGTAFGMAILRISPAGWWQGPLTGALVALSLEAFAVLVISQETLEWELGNLFTLSVPVILAAAAGGYVQRAMLQWPPRG